MTSDISQNSITPGKLTAVSGIHIIADEERAFDCLLHDGLENVFLFVQMRERIDSHNKIVSVLHSTHQPNHAVFAGDFVPEDLTAMI
jgi:hypothetical protein